MTSISRDAKERHLVAAIAALTDIDFEIVDRLVFSMLRRENDTRAALVLAGLAELAANAPLSVDDRRQRFACKVCCNYPNEHGELEHGKGCYEQNEYGGGIEYIEEAEFAPKFTCSRCGHSMWSEGSPCLECHIKASRPAAPPSVEYPGVAELDERIALMELE